MPSAQELLDEIDNEDFDYDQLDASIQNYSDEEIIKEVEDELCNSIYQELTVPLEERDVYWAQTLIDSV